MSEYKETGKIDEIVFDDITSSRILSSDELFNILKEVNGLTYKDAFTTSIIYSKERNYDLDFLNETIYIDYGGRTFISFENKLIFSNDKSINILGFIYQGCFISTDVLLTTIKRLNDTIKENQIKEEEKFKQEVNEKFQK